MNTKKKKSDFSQKLVEKLINRKAVISIEQYPYGVELYRHIYGSYSIGDSSKVDLYGKNYSGNDIMATDSSIKLVAYLASAYAAMEMGEEQALKDMKIDDVISRYYTSDLVENFSLNFNSPGKFELFVKSVSLAFFINISVCSLTYAGTVNPNDLNVINSAAGENASDGELDEACDKYRTLLNSISDNICDEVADLADTAKQKVGLQTSAKVTYNE